MSVLKITKENYEQEVLKSSQPVLLDFWASWCVPCQMAAPILEQIAAETEGSAKVGKINIEEEPELLQNFRIVSIPTFIVMKNGEEAHKLIGLQDKETLINLLK